MSPKPRCPGMVKPSGAPANVFMISLIFGDLCPLGLGFTPVNPWPLFVHLLSTFDVKSARFSPIEHSSKRKGHSLGNFPN
jgi:hypothetical protein